MSNSLHANVETQGLQLSTNYINPAWKTTHVKPKLGVSLDIANRYPVFRDRIYLSSLFEYLVTRGHIDQVIFQDLFKTIKDKALNNEVSFSDHLVWVGNRTLNTDYVIVSDALDKQSTRLFQNSTSFADAFSRIPIKGLGDVLSFTESQQQNFVKHLEDSLIIQDVFSFIADRILEFVVDSYHHTDSLLIIPSKGLENIFVLLDTIDVQYGKGLSHSLSLDDSNTTKQLNSGYTDAYYSTDQLDKSAIKTLSIDFFNLTDSGYLTTQSYADPSYFLENYVGEQRFF